MRIGLGSKKNHESASDLEGDEGLKPRVTVIKSEPLLAIERGYLVLALDYAFEGLPSWVKWTPSDQIMTISQMNGDVAEVRIVIKQEYIDKLLATKKLLLVSNHGDEKISHYVPFLA